MSLPAFEETSHVRRSRRLGRKVFDVPAASRTLPLVRRILGDIIDRYAQLAHRKLACQRLSGQETQDWQSRTTLYRLQDQIEASKAKLSVDVRELRGLGAALLDPVHGVVGFPTIVNGSLAYLVHCHDEEKLCHWRYRDQPKLRPIPQAWYSETPLPAESEGLLV